MKHRLRLLYTFVVFLATGLLQAADKPNLIFIMADDLGYGDLGCFGQKIIQTPRIDEMAAAGMKLTQFYAGSTVCAPSRCVLMTGQDTGHCWVRGNGAKEAQTLRARDITVAEKMREAGYATALIGKWGLGEEGTSGHPNRQGFDYFFGYLNQRHAHNYYPEFLFRGEEKVKLKNSPDPRWLASKQMTTDGAGFASPDGRIEYSHDLFVAESLRWIEKNASGNAPFFLYLPLTIPHANNEGTRGTGNGEDVPDYGIYADKPWPDPDKGQAAMITRMDRDVGRILDKLKALGIDDNTLVIFTSDNGPHKEGGNHPEFFDANGPLRGMKRDLTEGGIRVPTMARWPGKIEPGSSSDHVASFADFMATACQLAGVETPKKTQSHSFLNTLLGKRSEPDDIHYWEFYERGGKQAVRFGNWKAIRKPMFTGEIELYDLKKDIGEAHNLADANPAVVAQAAKLMAEYHVENPNWKVRGKKTKK